MVPRQNIWSRAAALAAGTPETRNRYVDFLRALSICAVIVGHWLIAAPYVSGGELSLSNMLEHQPWTRLLTWAFQVMPVFFIVGGYSNGVSWNSARRSGRPYSEWLRGRLQRLVGPVLPLLAVWALLGVIAGRLGMSPQMVAASSQMALIPIWFLAVYVGVVVLAPLTYAAWQRFGLASVAVLALAVVVDDVLFFAADLRAVGWLNYAFIWVAAHQLGYAWRDGYLAGPRLGLAWAVAGALLLVGLVTLGPYPVSMVSVPGEEVSNTLPPKLPMLALAIVQIGLLLSIEAPMRRWLERAAPWTATVLVNGMIMTVFLWHLTASTLVIGGAIWLGYIGLTLEPGSGAWWAARPLWLSVYALGLALFALAFMRFERGGAAATVAAWRQVLGAGLVCGGLALLALHGIGGDGPLGLRLWVLLLPFAGAALAGVNPLGRRPAHAAA
ncbi:MAG: acyltransferase [Gemmatimonadota bacterium]|nr:MAG: acyltransferase [Gemmatimonadota bacterium]